MKRSYLLGIVLFAVVVAAVVVVWDLTNNKAGNLPENAFEYNVNKFAHVDSALISHKESRQIRIKNGVPIDIKYANGNLYLAVDHLLQVISLEGKELLRFDLGKQPTCLTISPDKRVIVGFERQVRSYSLEGALLNQSVDFQDSSLFSAVATNGRQIFVADAGKKRVLVFDEALNQVGSFEGTSGVSDQHGFIVPSLHFDVEVNNDGELWVVNPGVHALQQYTLMGELRDEWRKTSVESEGFSGCCNPFYVAFLSDNRFVTSEKGLVRIKIHAASGELVSVVAPPSSFQNGHKAPVITVDGNDNIIALDVDNKLIRFFTPK